MTRESRDDRKALTGAFSRRTEGAVPQAASTAAAPIGVPTAFERDSARPGARTATKIAPTEQERRAGDQAAREAVQEGGLRVQHELVALRPQVIADLLGRGKRPAGLLAGAGGQASGRVGHLGAVDAVHQASEHSDPERTAELAGDVVDRRGDALLAPRQRRHDRRRRRCSGECHAGPEGQEAGEEMGVGRPDFERREDDEAERHQRQTRRTGDPDPEPRRDRGSDA